MPRKHFQIELEPGAACFHCDLPFEKPYRRMPEMESSANCVLLCPQCGCFTVLERVAKIKGAVESLVPE